MSKGVYKLRPADNWRIGEHESWLMDMASRGYHLEKVGFMFAKFTKGEPRDMRYRIDISQGRKLTFEEKEMYLEGGWSYVTTYGGLNVFSSPTDENAPELHTDPAEQSYTLGYLEKKLKKNTTIMAACMMVAVLSILFAYRISDSGLYLSLVEGNFIQYISFIIEFVLVFISLQAVISIGTLRKTLSEGRAINHSAPWRPKLRINQFVSIAVTGLMLFQIALIAIQISTFKKETLPLAGNNLPIVRLAEIEKSPDLERYTRPYLIKNNIDTFNNYICKWSLFSPVQYASIENGTVESDVWKQNESVSTIYTPSIYTSVYKLSFPSMQERVLSDLIKKQSKFFEGDAYIEREHPGFDKLIIHEGKSSMYGDDLKEIFAAKGKGVMHIRYNGKADIDSIIEAAAEKIALISE